MASTDQQVPAEQSPTAELVGSAFVHQYYVIMHQSPALVHRFYQDISKLGRPDESGGMSITTTMSGINKKILSLGYQDFTAEIMTVDAQDSHSGGVLVLVTGYLKGKDDMKRKFTQTFFLAPQDNGYFVLNDVFRYVDDVQEPVNDIKTPHTPEQDPSPVLENHIGEQPAPSLEEANGPEVYNPSENGDGSIEEEEAPVAEVVDEIPDDSQMVADSNSKIEEMPKKSYASILKVMKENAAPISASTHSPVKSAVKSHEQVGTTATPVPSPAPDTQISSNNVVENGKNQDVEAEGPSIYVKGLPANATITMLENEFKKFGPIKSGGIQVRSQKGFCFGFVEFEDASSVQSAIEASPITIGGRRAVVEEKRSTSRGNKGRSSSGAGGGYRNEGARSRGNYGNGRGYNRGEFGNRSEFGSRGNNRGYSNRGGDGYQRGEYMGSNGGRANRAGVVTVNAAAKNVAPSVSAPA